MAYDVFLVSAIEDRDVAKLIARRLRALKFRVWLDQKQTDETFDPKDARDAMNSQSMLVLWSEKAIASDWVRAAASVGHSRPGTLVQASLDKAIPYEPFRAGFRFALEGLTSRKTPEAFYDLIEELGRRDGRRDLREWMSFGADDDDKRAAWLAAHPTDPLALDARRKRERELGVKPKPAAAAIGAAALAAASLKGAAAPVAPPAPFQPSVNGHSPATAALMGEDSGVGWGTIAAVCAAILAMLMFAWMFRSQPAPGLPAIANARIATAQCPAGTMPRYLFEARPLETGPIIDDTATP